MHDLVRVRVQRSWSWGRFALYLFQRRMPDGKTTFIKSVEWEEVDEGNIMPEAAMMVDEEDIQMVMDELWRCGVRPSEVGTAGHVQAVEAERDYLRSIIDRSLPSALRKP